MNKKPVISPRETYVLDDDALRELDDASLTGVMRDLTSTMKQQLPSDMEIDEEPEIDFGILNNDD